MVTEKELLKIAIEKYPIGCRIDQKTAYNGLGGIYTIKSYNDYSFYNNNFSIGGIGVYDNIIQKWATVVFEPKEVESIINNFEVW